MAQQTVIYGSKELTGTFTGLRFDELPGKIADIYDLEMPGDCEFTVNGEDVEGTDIIEDRDSPIEIRAVPGKKA